ncbi:MAG: glycosyltransferase family 2 protein [Candidatus Caenarcaniphilales bacterium]|nr:glycosyltransferase family 2 protein [Candidatus Caenarcaniphilales bacterium]
MKRKLFSIVTPCYNEEENVLKCYQAVEKLFESELKNYELEYIFCDNCSTDRTVDVLKEIAKKDKRVKVIVNSNNFGAFRSMFNGMINTKGDIVVPFLPADMQDPPEVLIQFVKLWEEGYKVVYGQRTNRQESWFKKTLRKVFYRFIKKYSNTNVPVDAGEFQLIDRQVVEALKQFDDYKPYLRGMIAMCGFKSIGVPYTWQKREKGQSKAGLSVMLHEGLNGMVSMTNFPIRFGLILGFILSFLSILYAFIALILFIFDRSLVDRGIPTIMVALFFFSGVQLFFTSLIGEYVASIHSQVRKGPLVIEAERINFDEKENTDQHFNIQLTNIR